MTTSTVSAAGSRARLRPMMSWGTPIYTADFADGSAYNEQLRIIILKAEAADPEAALFGGINAIKSFQDLLRWDHPAIAWIRDRIGDAVTALTRAELGDAASEVTHGINAEAWAVVYRNGGSLRPHTHHDSVWSGVYYVAAGDTSGGADAGYLQLLDPRPAAVAVQATSGPERIRPVPGRMVAFPGWLPHSVQATADSDNQRICIAWNVAYDKTWSAMS